MSDSYVYPFDPHGNAITNKVSGEIQVISPPNWRDFYFIIPKAAPFYTDSLVITHVPTGKVLVEGVDYAAGHHFRSASRVTAKSVYGSITFFDKTLVGVITLSYQTVGGEWTLDEAKILQIMTDIVTNPRITTWEQVSGAPTRFPPIDHEWDVDDLVGMAEVVEKLNLIAAAILSKGDGSGGVGSIDGHLLDRSNPHQTTKTHVGLSQVRNYGIALQQDALDGLSNILYMTPVRVKEAVDKFAGVLLDSHVASKDNPHNTDKLQVGLGNVENLRLSTALEARAGTRTDRYMTPMLVAEAIKGLHADDKENPHETTKKHVGLEFVENYPPASEQQAIEGVSAITYMTPLTTRAVVASLTSQGVGLHTSDRDNPHYVTKDQVELGEVENYPPATIADAELGTGDTSYMTPATTSAAFAKLLSGADLPGVMRTVTFTGGGNEDDTWVKLMEIGPGTVEGVHGYLMFTGGFEVTGGGVYFSLYPNPLSPLTLTTLNGGSVESMGTVVDVDTGNVSLWLVLPSGKYLPEVGIWSSSEVEIFQEPDYLSLEPDDLVISPLIELVNVTNLSDAFAEATALLI